MNATGYTAQLNADLEEQLDRSLNRSDNCLRLPAELEAIDTTIIGGGFRDIGDGRIGAEIHGEATINASNFIELIQILDEKGNLGG